MRLQPLTPIIGAEVLGLDLAAPIDEVCARWLRDALGAHQVLVFRDQGHIAPSHQLALAACFGAPDPHPAYPTLPEHPGVNVLASTPERPTKIDTWHTDMTFWERPPFGSILRAVEIPASGGDTLFASLHAAFMGLSDRMRRYLVDGGGLEAVHSFEYGFRHSLAEPGGRERLADAVARNPPVRHPVVREHPSTGRPCLFVNRLFTTRIEGLSEAESDAILAFLFAQLEIPEYSVRVRWQPGTLVMWDNRATLHRPVNDYQPATRIMHRVTIAGDRPVAYAG